MEANSEAHMSKTERCMFRILDWPNSSLARRLPLSVGLGVERGSDLSLIDTCQIYRNPLAIAILGKRKRVDLNWSLLLFPRLKLDILSDPNLEGDSISRKR